MEKFKETLRSFLKIQEKDHLTRTFENLEQSGVALPSTSVSIPKWWSNSSSRASIWTDLGWKTKVTTLEGKIHTITFARGKAAKDMPEIEEMTPQEGMEEFKETLTRYLRSQKRDKITRTLENLESNGIALPSKDVSTPKWWNNSSSRAFIWTELGWKTKVTALEGKIHTITFARGKAAKDMPEIEEIKPLAVKEEVSQPVIPEKSDVSEVLKRDYLSIINKNIFGFVSIFIAILVFIARFNFFTYAAVVGICLVGVLIGLMGTRHSKKPIVAYIGVVLCLFMLLNLVLWMNYILENLD